ncbi:MAG: DegV family protein [Chloroflexi bacterium]|nr:DegV family protein [Chloroflexota bacterium]
MKMPVAVVTDSATALPPRLYEEAGLLVTPMEITLGGRTYDDGPDGVGDDFYDLLRSHSEIPRTSAPRPARWLENLSMAKEQADSIFVVTLAANMSAAYDSARVAAEMAREEDPDVEITVYDSRTAAGSEALIALAAARTAAAGGSHEEVTATAHRVGDRVRLVAYLDTLEYVWRSGRVPRVAVWATSLLKMKPVMEMTRGKVQSLARPRSRARAMDRIMIEMAKTAGALPIHVAVMHADAADEARVLHDQIERDFNCVELIVTQFAPFMGAHTGPGLVGASFWAES